MKNWKEEKNPSTANHFFYLLNSRNVECNVDCEYQVYNMLHNLSLLSKEELHELFLKESLRFTIGMDDGLSFNDLKQIRINLREIALELQNKNGQGNGH